MKILDDERDKLLDHEYDGIRELDNHMPVWWLWLFYGSILFGIGYLFYYEVFRWGPDQHEQYEMEMAAAAERHESSDGPATEEVVWTFSEDPADIAAGRELYMSTNQLCFTCHGGEGQGMVGPNLTDDYWMHGCTPADIAASIINGIPEMGMLPYGSGTRMSNDQVRQLISYIATLRGTNPAGAKEHNPVRETLCTEGPLAASNL